MAVFSVLALAATPAGAEETLVLRDGSRLAVKRLVRHDGKVRFEGVSGQVREVREADVVSPPLDLIPVLLRIKDGHNIVAKRLIRREGRVRFEDDQGRVRAVPEEQVASPPLASIPIFAPERAAAEPGELVVLKNRIAVKRLVRHDGRVRFEDEAGQVREVPEEDVLSPPLESIPVLLRLKDGTSIRARRLLRGGGQVRFEDMAGEARAVAEEQVLSPALASIAAFVPPVPAPALPAPAARVLAEASPEFVPFASRWRILDELPATSRRAPGLHDPYHQNVLKGDRPIVGDSVFLVLTATLDSLSELRRASGQTFTSPRAFLSLELFHGQTAFKPKTWAVRVVPALDVYYLAGEEKSALGVRRGTSRQGKDFSLEEAFAELKLRDLSPSYDAVSLRAGIQPFVSDFRGFLFSENNLGARLFGNLAANRWQYNAAWFDLLEKDTNSELNTFRRRDKKVVVANVFRQDFVAPGFTVSASFHRSEDRASKRFRFDANGLLVRPAPMGIPRLHDVVANYLGLAGDGHLGRLSLSHALYWASGSDEDNPLAERAVKIGAAMATLEASLDKDWVRFKASAFFASGDGDPTDGRGRGFDSIDDATNFAGGAFSFWSRSAIPLSQTGVLLKTPGSLLPSLRSSRFLGQASFVNPGVVILHAGADLEVKPKLRAVANASYLRFHKTEPLELLLFQPGIRKGIGFDLGAGVLYRPLLSENAVIAAGLTALLPGAGFRDIFSSSCPGCGGEGKTRLNGFLALRLVY